RENDRRSAGKYRCSPHAAYRVARHRRRLVLRPASVQECLLGEGHDVDLPPERHLHLQLFSAVLHDGADVDDRTLAQSESSLRFDDRRYDHPPHPDRHHDLHLDQQQRNDGHGRQFRLPPRSPEKRGVDAGDRGIWRHIRRNAGFRVDQADHGRGAALGQPVGRGPVWLQLFHDHGLSRHPCDDRSHLPDHHFAKSVAWRLRPRNARLFHQPEGALRDRRNHGSVLALRRSGVGVHLCPFLSLVRRHMAQAVAHVEGQQHPIKLYLVVWGWLFFLSTCSYLVDYFGLHGYLRWSLILVFMILKAGLIVAVFMHMAWERLALLYAILVPPVLVLVFVGIMVFESNYTLFTRIIFFGAGT